MRKQSEQQFHWSLIYEELLQHKCIFETSFSGSLKPLTFVIKIYILIDESYSYKIIFVPSVHAVTNQIFYFDSSLSNFALVFIRYLNKYKAQTEMPSNLNKKKNASLSGSCLTAAIIFKLELVEQLVSCSDFALVLQLLPCRNGSGE